MSKVYQQGLTLVELIVAVAIFAVVGTVSAMMLDQVMRADEQQQQRMETLASTQFALRYLQTDFEHIANRVHRNALGDKSYPVVANKSVDDQQILISFVRWDEFKAGVKLARVRYRLDKGVLYREVADQLDMTPQSGWRTEPLLENVVALSLRYYSRGHWNDHWWQEKNSKNAPFMPEAIEINLITEKLPPLAYKVLLPQVAKR